VDNMELLKNSLSQYFNRNLIDIETKIIEDACLLLEKALPPNIWNYPSCGFHVYGCIIVNTNILNNMQNIYQNKKSIWISEFIHIISKFYIYNRNFLVTSNSSYICELLFITLYNVFAQILIDEIIPLLDYIQV